MDTFLSNRLLSPSIYDMETLELFLQQFLNIFCLESLFRKHFIEPTIFRPQLFY